MPSKGIQTYCWIAVPGCTVTLSIPGHQKVEKSQPQQWLSDRFEAEVEFTGTARFEWKVLNDAGAMLADGYSILTPPFGEASSGTMNALSQMKTKYVDAGKNGDHLMINYGFYDAGLGEAGLPNFHQFWVTVTPDHGAWMAKLAPGGSSESRQPFSSLVLPAAHDPGMNSMENCDIILRNSDALKIIINGFNKIGGEILKVLDNSLDFGSTVISGLAITQKDSIDTMLHLGARYLEFRPAHVSTLFKATDLPDELYFQHNLIPGLGYLNFLKSVLRFLKQNSSEIVVVHLRQDGLNKTCAPATSAEKKDYLKDAIQATESDIIVGTLDDMTTLSIDDLRVQKKRLIVLDEAMQYSSYGGGNSTLTPNPIIEEFEGMTKRGEAQAKFAIFQCQATATNLPGPVVASLFSKHTTSSVLVSTKPICDQKTLPWLQHNLPGKMDTRKLMVIMNDFFDGATADVAIGLSKKFLQT